ncbi:AGAP010766-PA-like protein [Anopheles sinensis]|uniref:AGAP010766-PA-like protein n=1 Tax=Anopheles sinensis TaxID=74873 RepID=A0A084WUH1_ANOSI|nr:AGAP010766-PA-like protein [Anopheles sinensis]
MPALDDSEISVPPYIGEELIVQSITDGLRVKNVRVVEHKITRAVSAGDNYMSDVYRIVVRFTGDCDTIDRSIEVAPDGTSKTVSLVVKSLPNTGKRGTIIEDLQTYEKEVAMFRDVVPKLSQLVGGTFFAARCYHATNVPDRVIVFEDLKALGYVNSNRQAGFDFHQCALVMEKIGRFHAASMRLAEQEPDLMRKQFHFNMFNPAGGQANDDIHAVFEKGLETLIGVVRKNWDGFDPSIVAKLEQLVPVYVERLRKCLEQDVESDGGFRVLNHGDLWSNNIMIRYDPNEPSTVRDVVFVDLQISFYTSPGIDLNYVLANCPNYETRTRLDELIDVYYRSFSATLRQLQYHTVPTMEQVRREIRRMEFFSLVSVVSVLPIVLMDQTDEVVADMESLLSDGSDGEKAREIQYNGVNYQRIVRPMLVEFNRRGLLDL